MPDELYFLNNATMNRMADMYEDIFPSFDRQRYRELTEVFGLEPKKSTNTFSKGMRRQAATILAIPQARYIFLMRPLTDLTPLFELCENLICQDVMERKASAIITSHSLRELEDTCDQLALLHKGGLVLESDIQHLKTAQFKIQIAFQDEYDRSRFEGIDILHFVKHGSVSNMIVRGSREETVAKLKELNPSILDVLPLSLEEVFTYEMEALGYSFNLE